MNENVVQFFHKMRLAQQVHQRDNVLDAILRRIVALFGMQAVAQVGIMKRLIEELLILNS